MKDRDIEAWFKRIFTKPIGPRITELKKDDEDTVETERTEGEQ